ncbi:MAG: hypothetical protein ACREQF_12755, partial [Candidatus Binataceae bacterium]
MIGGTLGTVGGALLTRKLRGGPPKLSGGGTIPAAGAEAFGAALGGAAGAGLGVLSTDQLAASLESAGLITSPGPPATLDESAQRALNETVLDLATGTSITVLPMPAKMLVRRVLGLVGDQPVNAAKLALRYNLALGMQNVSSRTLSRSYNNVMGVMPLLAGGQRRAVTGIKPSLSREIAVTLGVPGVARSTPGVVPSMEAAEKGISHLLGPSMSLADLGITFRNAGRASYELFERQADRLYDSARKQAVSSGARIPNDQLQQEALAVRNELTNLPRRTVREVRTSSGVQETTREPVMEGDPSILTTTGTKETQQTGKLPVREETERVSSFDPDTATRTVETARERVREGVEPISPDAESKVLRLLDELRGIEDVSGAVEHDNLLRRVRSLMEDYRDNPTTLRQLVRLREAMVRDRTNLIGPQSVRDAWTAADEFYAVGNRMFENPTAAKFQAVEKDVFSRRARGVTDLQLQSARSFGLPIAGDKIKRAGGSPVEHLFSELFRPGGEIGMTASQVKDLQG